MKKAVQHKKKQKTKLSKKTLLLFLIALIGISFIFIKLLWANQRIRILTHHQASLPTQWKTFTSKLGFSFEYPSDWGNVVEKISDAKKDGTGDSGKTYSLSFSAKSNVNFNYRAYGAGQSFDYSAGRGVIFTDYIGDATKPTSVTNEITMGLADRCYQYPVQYYPYRGVLRFNLPGREISGVILVVPILSPADMEKYEITVNNFISQDTSCKNPEGPKSPHIAIKEQQIIENLYNGINFDSESQINLTIFKHISSSATIH